MQAPYNARSLHSPDVEHRRVSQIIFKPEHGWRFVGGKIETAEANAIACQPDRASNQRPAQVTLTRDESIRESYKRPPN